MSSPEQNKQRNREIAENEAERQVTGDVRVSVWAITAAVIAGVIVLGIAWAWFNPLYRAIKKPARLATGTRSGFCKLTALLKRFSRTR